jgi:ubiquinone/menaquinone biosynthesis C-methylase UbiE
METKKQAENYDLIADHWNGDNFNRNNGIEQHKRALRLVKNKRSAIDIGCGSSGRILDLLVKQGFDAEGLDFSKEMLRLAQLRHPNYLSIMRTYVIGSSQKHMISSLLGIASGMCP